MNEGDSTLEKYLSTPHGGKLVNRRMSQSRKQQILDEIDEFTQIQIDNETRNDVRNIAEGVFSPLEGFMVQEDYLNVIYEARLTNGLPWTIPIVLDVPQERAVDVKEGDEAVLIDDRGQPIALIKVLEQFKFNKQRYASHVFGTIDNTHPGVRKILTLNNLFIGGKIELITNPPTRYEQYYFSPFKTRTIFEKLQWNSIAGFQTRNIPHLGHEYIQKTALTFVDGVFINPIIGRKKMGDFKDEVIISTYTTLLKNYFPEDRAILGILQTEMRYAGPKEAIFHAIIRKNFGCTHFIVGRDHAGVGDFYSPYAAHEIFDKFPDLGIIPLFFPSVYFCNQCKLITNDKACPHSHKCHQIFSGTQIRKEINNQDSTRSAVRPEIAEILIKWRSPLVELNYGDTPTQKGEPMK
jgi:sulfate adenylyltransferase